MFGRACGRVDLSAEARASYCAVYPELTAEQPGLFGAIVARAEAHVLRNALVYALLDKSKGIEKAHLLAGIALWEFAQDSARFIFGESTGDPEADGLLAELRKRGQMDATQVRDFLGHHASDQRKREIAERFVREGLARIDNVPTGGRDRVVWTAVAAAKWDERDESPRSGDAERK
jgi:hypothetical protein